MAKPHVKQVLTRANYFETAIRGCDSRFGLYHVAVVLSFLRSPMSLAEI